MSANDVQRSIRGFLVALTIAVTGNAAAVTVVECIDETGGSSFREFCPPGSTKKGEKILQGKLAPAVDIQEVAAKYPVTVYSIPNCNACDIVRLQLQQRKVPFAEKDVSTDRTLQQEVRTLTGKAEDVIKVPVIRIGGEVLPDYKPADLNAKLDAAGYPTVAGEKPTSNASIPPAGAPAAEPPPAGANAAPPAKAGSTAAATDGAAQAPAANTYETGAPADAPASGSPATSP